MPKKYKKVNKKGLAWKDLSEVEKAAIKKSDQVRLVDASGPKNPWMPASYWSYSCALVYQGRTLKKKEPVGFKSLGGMWCTWGAANILTQIVTVPKKEKDVIDYLGKGSGHRSLSIGGLVFHKNPEAPLEEWKKYSELIRHDLPRRD